MQKNLLIKLFVSIPVILIFLYFIPFLGICLLLLRFFIYGDKRNIFTISFLLVIGILILIPMIFPLLNINISNIKFLGKFINSDLYKINFVNYSKLIITISIIFFILSVLFKVLFSKFNFMLGKYISEIEKEDRQIRKENNLKMQKKQERAKHTNYVRCPYCGADNILTDKTGVCKFCRRTIENKAFQNK